MKLADVISNYIEHKRSLGMTLRADAPLLREYCRAMGNVEIEEVESRAAVSFIGGDRPVTTYWGRKYSVLRNFYRFAIARDFVSTSPLPHSVAKQPQPLIPYIYTVEELRRMISATEQLQNSRGPLQVATMRTLLLLLYGTGLRRGEAISLNLSDVDLSQRLITVRETKFYKTRLVPTGPKLTNELTSYAKQRRKFPLPAAEASAFFATRTGQRLTYQRIGKLFRRVRTLAGITREPQARYQPRLHDLRHTAAVHRVVAWYRQGADVQRLLPQLATYMGHVDIAATQRYLTMTPELLNEAGLRFERYAQREADDE